MERFDGPGLLVPTGGHRHSLSPDDALVMVARDQSKYRSSGQSDARFYRQIKEEAGHLSCGPKSSFRNASDPMPPRRLSTPHARASSSQTVEHSSSMWSRSESKGRASSKKAMVDFTRLPLSVFECILDQIRSLHDERLSSSCATCYMRDLAALRLTCSAWDTDTRRTLYEHIDIVGVDSPSQLRKYRMHRGSRLRLLRRTLRERKLLASMVKTLNVPDPNIPIYLPDGQPNPEFEEHRDLVASVVMICPSLERLSGFYTFYNHEFDRLNHALSTRKKLREHIWIIGENDDITARSRYQLSPGLLDPYQTDQFLQYHKTWTELEYLMLCSPGGVGVIEHGIFVEVLGSLPALQHLCISSFDADDFTDQTLLALPDLISLRIEECSGVTGTGLAKWAAFPAAYHLQTLSLIHQNLTDLMKISKVLTSLTTLKKFVIIQSDVVPTVPSDAIIFQPLLASLSLEHLHWDIASGYLAEDSASCSTGPSSSFSNISSAGLENQLYRSSGKSLTPNAHLALSILHSGFPSLRTLRAPQDVSPPGVLQAICRPSRNGNVLLPTDKHGTRPRPLVFQSNVPSQNSLHVARIRAQEYIDGNIKAAEEFMKVIVTDHSDLETIEDSGSSKAVSDTSTDPTDLDDTVAPQSTDSGAAVCALTPLSKERNETSLAELACPWSESLLSFNQSWEPLSKLIPIPKRSPLRRRLTVPTKVREFSLPSFIGRVASTTSRSAPPPWFNLQPDIPGRDGNGGIVGWGDLLRVTEKANPAVNGKANPEVKDGCTGAWNRGRDTNKAPEWFKHTERERWRPGNTIELRHFF